MVMPLTVGTFCSGTDAPIHALRRAAIEHIHVFSAETSGAARRFIETNGPPPQLLLGDVRLVDIQTLPRVDLFVAGPPCQSFSTIPSSKTRAQMAERVSVFKACISYILAKGPRVGLVENVAVVRRMVLLSLGRSDPVLRRGASADSNTTWEERISPILRELSESYFIHTDVLSPHDFGCPQQRKRCYVVLRRKDSFADSFAFPEPVPLTTSVFDIVDVSDLREHFKLTENTKQVARRCLATLDNEDGAYVVSSKTVELRIKSGQPIRKEASVSDCIINSGRHLLLSKRNTRALSRNELLRLQGFENVITNSLTYIEVNALVGNAMNVTLLTHLFKTLFS